MINPISIDNYPKVKGILDTPNERRAVEFKPSLPWRRIDDSATGHKLQEVIRSILGMSNIRDGGLIILGIEKDRVTGNYTLKGMQRRHLQTYDSDHIYQIIRNFSTPESKFEVINVEFKGMFFIIFDVQAFLFSPVICVNKKVNIRKLENSVIYIRNHKPETKKITEPSEMQELINLAVERELSSFSSRMGNIFKSMSRIQVTRTADKIKFKKQRGNI